jgi:NADH dehydrogenase
LPATAQVASQMASWVSKTLKYTAQGGKMQDKPGFVWKNKGSMVFVGDYRVGLHFSMGNGNVGTCGLS